MKAKIFIFAPLMTVFLLSAGASSRPIQTGKPKPPLATGCDKALWKFVYSPARLEVIQDCITVTGTIIMRRPERDGDWHMILKLDREFERSLYLNSAEHQTTA